MIKVGIINPSWTINRHNTDHRCVIDFSNIGVFNHELTASFVGSKTAYLKANINLFNTRILGRRIFDKIAVPVTRLDCDVLYDYGGTPWGLCKDQKSSIPTLTTLGFPVLRQSIERGRDYLVNCAEEVATLAERSSRIHFHTECMRDAFLTYAPTWEDRSEVVPFFMPHLRFIPEADLISKFEADRIDILFVGADGTRKGIIEICQALDTIAGELHSMGIFTTFVSRTTPSCRNYRNILHYRSLPREAVQKLMKASQIYLMVPRVETFGLVYVEAMAAGCAVIADDDLPRQEILERGRSGLMIKPGRIKDISEAVLQLASDKSIMRKLALTGWRHALARYEPGVVATGYAQIFKRLAA